MRSLMTAARVAPDESCALSRRPRTSFRSSTSKYSGVIMRLVANIAFVCALRG